MVLCVAGQHRAIEVVAGEGCHMLGQAGQVASLDLSGVIPFVGDGCPQGCSDTALGGGPSVGASKNKKASELRQAASLPLSFGDGPGLRLVHRQPFDSARIDSPRALRTIILLC